MIPKLIFQKENVESKSANAPHKDYFINLKLAQEWKAAPHEGPIELRVTHNERALYFSYSSPEGPRYSTPISMHKDNSQFKKEIDEIYKHYCKLIFRTKQRMEEHAGRHDAPYQDR